MEMSGELPLVIILRQNDPAVVEVEDGLRLALEPLLRAETGAGSEGHQLLCTELSQVVVGMEIPPPKPLVR